MFQSGGPPACVQAAPIRSKGSVSARWWQPPASYCPPVLFPAQEGAARFSPHILGHLEVCRLNAAVREGPGGVRTASRTPSRRVTGGAEQWAGAPGLPSGLSLQRLGASPARHRPRGRPLLAAGSAVCAPHWPRRAHVTPAAKTAGRSARLPAGEPAAAARGLGGPAKVAGGRSEDLRMLSG